MDSRKPRPTLRKKNISELKKELDLDVHRISLEEVYTRFDTSFNGLLTVEACRRLELYGPNQLTPPKTLSEWVRFCQQLFGGFQILLWTGAILCFLAYGIQTTQFDSPPGDYVQITIYLKFPF